VVAGDAETTARRRYQDTAQGFAYLSGEDIVVAAGAEAALTRRHKDVVA